MRSDRSLFRSYVCQSHDHQRCRRRYRPTVGVIPRICGCWCHDGPPYDLGETVDYRDVPWSKAERETALRQQR